MSAVHSAFCLQKLYVVCCSWSMVSSSWESPPSRRLEVSPWLCMSASINGEVSASSTSCQYPNYQSATSGKRPSSTSFNNHSPGHSHGSTQKQISTSFLFQYTAFSRRAFVCLSFSQESSNCRAFAALVPSCALLSNS